MRTLALIFTGVVALTGCGSDAPTERGADPASAAVTADAGSASSAVELTGKVIEVQMITDENGNYFEPAELTVQRGDVVRFLLVSGVHNATFPASENPRDANLPTEMAPLLQLPGQTYDVTVDFGPGEYFFQCDPHAALGMVGTLTVEN